MSRRRRTALGIVAAAVGLVAPGCGGGPDTTYGRSRSQSINGTTVLADLFRQRGHTVRAARRLSDELRDWADVIVRFAPQPGPVPHDEAEWYTEWLARNPGRALVYVPYDYDAEIEYWDRALAQLPPTATGRTRERVETARNRVNRWELKLPHPTTKPAPAAQWFAVETAVMPTVCKRLGGLWAVGVDPAKAALTVRQALKVDAETVLLTGDGKPLVIDWTLDNGARVLVPASGVFLLNLPLTEPARWPLAVRTAAWVEGDVAVLGARPRAPRRIAFVEGSATTGAAGPPSVFALLWVEPFGRVAAQLFALGLATCLALAPRLGRARPDEPSGADRPVAHPEALGSLLAHTGRIGEARALLETYRRWRAGGTAGRAAPQPSPPAPDGAGSETRPA